MMITLELRDIKTLCADAAALGVAMARRHDAPALDLISQSEAFRRYDRQRVNMWREMGLLTVQRKGSSQQSHVMYSVAELTALDNATRMHVLFNRVEVDRILAEARAREAAARAEREARKSRPGRPAKK